MSHDSRGALLKKGDTVLIEGVLIDDPSQDNGYCNCNVQIVTPEQSDKPPMQPSSISAINTRMLTKVGACIMLLIFGLLAFAPVEAQARGGKGFGRGWGLRKLLPRNWGNRNNAAACNAACNTQAACNAACNTQAAAPVKAPANVAGLVDARPAVPLQPSQPQKVFPYAESTNATFEDKLKRPIIVVFWMGEPDSTGIRPVHEIGNYEGGDISISETFPLVAKNCKVHPEMKHYAAKDCKLLPYTIFVKSDGTQEIVRK